MIGYGAVENMLDTLRRLELAEEVVEDNDFFCCADCDGWTDWYGDDEDEKEEESNDEW